MAGKKIRWGNLFILLLIITAAISAFYYKYPEKLPNLFNREEAGMEKEGPSAKGIKKSPQDTFIMGLDSWIGGTPALIALSRQYNKDYSLNLELQYIPNDEDRMDALKKGEIHITEMSLPAYVRFLNKYPNAGVIIGITDFSRGADGIVSKSEIKTLNDMEGKKVSYVGDGTGKFILNKFLRLTGLRFQDINPVEHDEMSEVVEDLKSGKADLIVSWSPDMNLAVKEINSAHPGSVKLLITTKEVPDLVPTVLVASKDINDQYPDMMENFLKTWYVSAKYMIEKPDKAYDKLTELMLEKKDIYGDVTLEDVQESFSTIKLMSLNDNFEYFGLTGKEKVLTAIINDTAQTWKKYGDISSDTVPGDIIADNLMAMLFKENDKELMVGSLDSAITGNTSQPAESQKEFKKQDEISIEKNTEKVAKVDIPPVYYDSGKATVQQESVPVLNEVLNVLRQFPQYYLIIDAHTDSIGSEESNLKLSRDRAEEVRNYLISQGVNANRLVARGWGESKLVVAVEKTEEDMAKNRRTEFILTRETD